MTNYYPNIFDQSRLSTPVMFRLNFYAWRFRLPL
jgi:hypothetical protein